MPAGDAYSSSTWFHLLCVFTFLHSSDFLPIVSLTLRLYDISLSGSEFVLFWIILVYILFWIMLLYFTIFIMYILQYWIPTMIIYHSCLVIMFIYLTIAVMACPVLLSLHSQSTAGPKMVIIMVAKAAPNYNNKHNNIWLWTYITYIAPSRDGCGSARAHVFAQFWHLESGWTDCV